MSKSIRKLVDVIGICLFISLLTFGIVGSCRNRVSGFPLENVVQIKVISTEIDWYTGEPKEWQGSGVFIEDDLILTAGHIVEDVNELSIKTVDGWVYKGLEWYKETEADVGFIKIKSPKKEKRLQFDSAKLGEEIWVYGNPFGVFPLLTKGIISAINMPDSFRNTKSMIIIDAAVDPGNSGCPVFDKNGNILGIAAWKYIYSNSLSYFVRAEVIELSLKKYKAIKALEVIE